jgi:hypothetical protein
VYYQFFELFLKIRVMGALKDMKNSGRFLVTVFDHQFDAVLARGYGSIPTLQLSEKLVRPMSSCGVVG